jgi:hypothetical protein
MKSNIKVNNRLLNYLDKDAEISEKIRTLRNFTNASEYKIYKDKLKRYKKIICEKYEIEKFLEESEEAPREVKDVILS